METQLPILLQDEYLVAIHKPPGILMHRSPISRDTVFVLQTLRDQIGQRVYPVHRLDRATSGVLLFGLSPEAAQKVVRQFEERTVEKEYRALARGWVDDQGVIDHPVADEEGNNIPQEAITDYRCLQRGELPFAVDRYPTSRYSLVSVSPRTGRRQQIRRHFKHISHHLIGDTTHGNGKHNRFFREQFGIRRLMLTSQRLGFTHPYSGERIMLEALPELEWQLLNEIFGWPED
jgi:tRNA pseudouridine65 synthase